MFKISNKDDNILLGELSPYLMGLDEVDDVLIIIDSNWYGQLILVLHDHDLFNIYEVVEEWSESNIKWSQRRFNTSGLPILE